ncbi:Efflux transporter, outer membrane factor (OMF) lipoprotein, NodT family [Beijerinckiaceae bacterium RH AL1]|nr:efflux transporter outer membrane subunit [Beijerinckiaceae bacterium]VVB47703.1 Efflux transporter, outer membrane factor (OMF) lipoprotein, NodT family [Beijerinckiaceae bacterium RH CH11]VVB47784.1 Efflux transporter, outer membrane factor (OMF) lipoprotein, NodT family [Beijerinckiaceae bacterium RH AL8]VVC56022.1 Efflux transporter, outer membrane factor (OMF) lipoprotein, NodT family [Beijerinckiaceae bacterium RH AL1]
MTMTSTLGGCLVGPNYVRPSAPTPEHFKEAAAPAKGWKRVSPLDTIDRGAWWDVYRDPTLSALASQVDISNQSVASAAANYVAAREAIKEAQASLFPTVTASHTTTASGSRVSRTTLTFVPSATATWDIDVWGRIRRNVEASAAAAQASAADLQNAKLSEQGALLTAYYDLRATDALKDLYDRTAAAYQKTLEITRNEFKGGTVSEADVVTAQTQLYQVQALSIDTGVLRAQYEHAIALLIGRPPADLRVQRNGRALPPPPATPITVPARLLERRPDVAAAERTLQQDSALIGVAVANFYPDINLTALFSYTAGPPPVSMAGAAWSIAGSATQPIFDGGLLSAQLAAARANYDSSVATYRQTVLTAFQQVEDALAAIRVYAAEAAKDRETVAAAKKAVAVYLNQYQAGTVAFTTVVTAQATQLTAEESLLAVQQSQLIESVALIQALGGGWHADELSPIETLTPVSTLTPPL